VRWGWIVDIVVILLVVRLHSRRMVVGASAPAPQRALCGPCPCPELSLVFVMAGKEPRSKMQDT
jgi:hypothetical protein